LERAAEHQLRLAIFCDLVPVMLMLRLICERRHVCRRRANPYCGCIL
jgi:hypothetical protein